MNEALNLKDASLQVTHNPGTHETSYQVDLQFTIRAVLADALRSDKAEPFVLQQLRESLLHGLFEYLVEHDARDLAAHASAAAHDAYLNLRVRDI